jgi:hypothetical protein
MIMKKIYSLSAVAMLAMLLVSMTGYGQLPELVARYPLDETSGTVVADISGNGFDATASCETCWAEGTIDGAYEFSGAEAITLPADVMGMTSNDGSVAFWMNTPALSSDIRTMFWGGDNETGGGFGAENELHIHLEGGPSDYWLGGECSFFAIADPNTFVHSDPEKGGPAGVTPVNPILLGDSEWHHIAATWGSGFVALYIDGVVMWDTTLYNPTGYALDHMYLGQMANASRTFIGKMDDVRIYKGVLSSFEVEDLFNKNTTRIDQRLADESNLSVYPNPATKDAAIRFTSEAGKNVSVHLYSLTGASIGHIYNGMSVAGENRIELNTENYSAGLYIIELKVDNKASHAKFILK